MYTGFEKNLYKIKALQKIGEAAKKARRDRIATS